ncbi:hypothetical protein Q5P01_019397 [Channa striata]|uniref:Ig-like domain-containing protein n=1 Tax=Channa striata TaxID=64152 RepID=A0AA88M3W7_CHASR|nr:hypothetical protein Q5P01_019397 [Channa striata]
MHGQRRGQTEDRGTDTSLCWLAVAGLGHPCQWCSEVSVGQELDCVGLLKGLLPYNGLVSSSKSSLSYLLSRPEGGNVAIIAVRKRKGFIKLALKHGAQLVPVFSFGENESENPTGSLLRTLQTSSPRPDNMKSVSLLLGTRHRANPPLTLRFSENPVMTGSDVTLTCEKTTNGGAVKAYFHINGKVVSHPVVTFTISKVQQSDKGLYSCSTDEDGKAPQVWLKVKGQDTEITSCLKI